MKELGSRPGIRYNLMIKGCVILLGLCVICVKNGLVAGERAKEEPGAGVGAGAGRTGTGLFST